MKKLFILLILVLIYFPAYSQFTGGGGGGSDKAQIRTRTILSVDNEQEKAFFEQIKIISASNSFSIEWTDKIKLEQIEIIDILGRLQKVISVSFDERFAQSEWFVSKGIYFIRFRDNENRFFSKKVVL